MGSYTVNRFRHCPNPDCHAHYPSGEYEGEVPNYHRERAGIRPIKVCRHCGMVWYEELDIDSRRYFIIRDWSQGDWRESRRTEVYILKRRKRRR